MTTHDHTAATEAGDYTVYISPSQDQTLGEVVGSIQTALNGAGVRGHFDKEEEFDYWLWSEDGPDSPLNILSVRPTSEIDDVQRPFKLLLAASDGEGIDLLQKLLERLAHRFVLDAIRE